MLRETLSATPANRSSYLPPFAHDHAAESAAKLSYPPCCGLTRPDGACGGADASFPCEVGRWSAAAATTASVTEENREAVLDKYEERHSIVH